MSQSLLLDVITRIYKNSANRVIGIHCISIQENREILPHPRPGYISDTRFHRSAIINSDFHRLNLSMGESRIIASVQMIGKYDDFNYNTAVDDIKSVIYFGVPETNDIEISLVGFPQIGDTL